MRALPLPTPAVLLEISRILNTGLDMETLSICVRLCEQGINPEALSAVIKELRKATEALKTGQLNDLLDVILDVLLDDILDEAAVAGAEADVVRGDQAGRSVVRGNQAVRPASS
ncbi:Mitotic-spindle organizing protein 1 [Myotis brandtii]|uniref:Mitotic-spindle organizing protein 1 n=1 Tax=Myotis brandtii TaxID=109478 RepID=S7QF62_MYOBR|nr:Mitotic-spindle organizing protein 1 [Myotis brandtii]